jgi:hypothetical protein
LRLTGHPSEQGGNDFECRISRIFRMLRVEQNSASEIPIENVRLALFCLSEAVSEKSERSAFKNRHY